MFEIRFSCVPNHAQSFNKFVKVRLTALNKQKLNVVHATDNVKEKPNFHFTFCI